MSNFNFCIIVNYVILSCICSVKTLSLIYHLHILHKSQSLSPQTVISHTTWTSQFHLITTLSCITTFTIAFIKNHITNACIHISHQIIHNTFSQASSRLRQYDTADCQRPKATTTLYTDFLLCDLLH